MPSRKKPPLGVEPDYTRQQTAIILNCGLVKVDELCADGTLESYKLSEGRRGGRRIVRESVQRLRRGRPVKPLQAEHPGAETEAGQ